MGDRRSGSRLPRPQRGALGARGDAVLNHDLRHALCDATSRLRAAGIDQPAREARLLLNLALGLPQGTWPGADAAVPAALRALVLRRAAREPMARLRGVQGFWTLDLALSAETLIPRADSEALIEAALAAFPQRDAVRRVLDFGTGSGALLLAALAEFASAWGVGIDRSQAATATAQRNAVHNGLADRAAFVCGDWASCLQAEFDLVLCNPPYIATAAIADLMPEVARHEPVAALDGGADGLASYRCLAPELPRVLRAGGVAVLELGRGQAEAVARLLERVGLAVVAMRTDLGGIVRAVVAQKPVGEAPG